MSEIYSMPGHLIRRLQQISASVFAENMKAVGLDMTSPQFAALMMIDAHPEIDQATLAGLIAFDRPTIGGVIDRLAAKGLVERTVNPDDRRARVLKLTNKGYTILTQMKPVVARTQDAILPGLTEPEKAEFIRLAIKIAEAGNNISRAPLLTLPQTNDDIP